MHVDVMANPKRSQQQRCKKYPGRQNITSLFSEASCCPPTTLLCCLHRGRTANGQQVKQQMPSTSRIYSVTFTKESTTPNKKLFTVAPSREDEELQLEAPHPRHLLTKHLDKNTGQNTNLNQHPSIRHKPWFNRINEGLNRKDQQRALPPKQ